MYDICCIGHLTRDHIVTPDSDIYMPGGTSYYVSLGMVALRPEVHGLSYKLVTSLAEKDMALADELTNRGIDTTVIPSRETMFFENIYGTNLNIRSQRVTATADAFRPNDLRDINAKYVILGSLLAEDFSIEIFEHFHRKSILAVDAQGFLRSVRNQHVYDTDWSWKKEALKHTDILKINQREGEILTGESDMETICAKLAEWGVREILLTLGDKGSLIFRDGIVHRIAASHTDAVIDTTGCGDTYMMGYIFQRTLGADIQQAGQFASVVSAMKLANHGPFNGSYDEAIARMPQR